MKKTKIVCTIGPSCNNKSAILNLIKSGMDVARLNFSHGNYILYKKYIKIIRDLSIKINKPIPIILDTKGPEIRTLRLKNSKSVYLKKGSEFGFVYNLKLIGNNKIVGVSYNNFFFDVNIGNFILVDDGLIKMKIIDKKDCVVICEVLNEGYLGENKGINIPDVNINLPFLSEKDKDDLIFGIENKLDYIASSFVRSSEDVAEIKNFLDSNGGESMRIISKIENKKGLKNFDKILNISDGIMVARGDLGVEIPVEDVILAQKMMIKKCNLNRKIVITATQMLESMVSNPRPTRAEAGDVANAVLDGTDAVMLSAESANGNYPVETVKIMSKICLRIDDSMNDVKLNYSNGKYMPISEAICKSSVDISKKLNASLILVYTIGGKSPRFIRKYFPKSLILALTSNKIILRQLMIVRGVIPFLVDEISSTDLFYKIGKNLSISSGYAKVGDIIVMVSGALVSYGISNTVSVHVI